jgi:N utilization substance protein A
MSIFIANALSPAKVMNVLLDDSPDSGKTATVIVPDRQLSLAIGKEGQNARLAAKLTGWRIDIKSATEAAEETMGRLEDIHIAPEDMDLLSLAEVYLRKRGDGPTEEERERIRVEVEQRSIEDVIWPDEEPAPEPEPVLAEEEAKAAAEAALPEAAQETAAEVDQEATEPEEVQPPDWLLRDEDALKPTFEGEPIEDSLGWVPVAPEVDYYSGWDEDADGQDDEAVDPSKPQVEWVREDFGELEERQVGRKKKKKKPGRTASPRYYDDEYDWKP